MKKYCIFWIIFLVLFIIGFLKTLFHMDAGHVIAQILFLGKLVQQYLNNHDIFMLVMAWYFDGFIW